MKCLVVVGAAALLCLCAGCQDTRVTNLEQRVNHLEQSIRELEADPAVLKHEVLADACPVRWQQMAKETIQGVSIGVQVGIDRLRRPELVDDEDNLGSILVPSLKQGSRDCRYTKLSGQLQAIGLDFYRELPTGAKSLLMNPDLSFRRFEG
ncbi:MAG: hypothetical protein WBQ04_00640 [Candidatus Acidiferrales bacterium]